MGIRKKKSVIVAAVAVFFLVGVIVGTRGWTPSTLPTNSNDRPLFVYPFASDTWYQRANDSIDVERTGARSAIVAHHLLVADKIAEQIAMLGTGEEKTVVILSPNHFSLGRSAMQTAVGEWRTPDGELESDDEIVEALRERVDDLTLEPETFKQEHGVSTIVPFVKRWFPRAKVVALAIHDKATVEQTDALAQAIVEFVPDAIVIASVDMSHNLPEHIRIPHDAETLAAIERGKCGDISVVEEGWECNLEIDANGVLETLFLVNQLRGTQDWQITHHGSSLAMDATDDWRENTSHILGYFERGEPIEESFLSIQFVGDVMLDRGVRSRIESQGVDYPWRDVARFLQGAQLRVANFEGTISEDTSVATVEPPFRFTFAPEFVEVMSGGAAPRSPARLPLGFGLQAGKPIIDVVSIANNHSRDRWIEGEQETRVWLDELGLDWFSGYATAEPVYRFSRVSIIGYHQFGFPIHDLTPIIEKEDQDGRFVIVYSHWGEEYVAEPQDGQRELAQKMIEAGADLIIGSHPHVVQGIEMIDGVPVIYSLGNFVFDQVAPGTDVGMSVTVLFYENGGMIYLSPVETRDCQPTPLSDEESKFIFENIASLSTEDLVPYILEGMIPFD